MIWSISELKIEQHQEIALLRQETADLHKQLTSARIRIATLEERAIHRDARNDELQNTLNGRDGRDEKVKDLMDERNRGQLPRSEERYGYQIQARYTQTQAQDIQIQELKNIRNLLPAGAILVLLAIVLS